MQRTYTKKNSGASFNFYGSNSPKLRKTRIFVACLLLWPIPLSAGEIPNVKTVLEAWQKRQDRVSSARFSWAESRFLKAGAVINQEHAELLRKRSGKPRNSKNDAAVDRSKSNENGSQRGIIPDKDITCPVTHKMILDRNKVRYESQGKTWREGEPEPLDQESISVYDGEMPKTFVQSVAFGNPRGWIHKSPRNLNLWQYDTIPILLLYRPFHPELRDINREKLSVSNQQAIIAGKHCFALQQIKNPEKEAKLIIWAALQPDYPIMRMQESASGTIYVQFDFSYSVDKDFGDVLSGWKYISSSSSGDMMQSSTSIVHEYELNKPIDSKDFQLDFPTGTFVSNLKNQRGELGEFYIVRENQSKRNVSREELVSKSYEQLLANNAQVGIGRKRALWWLLFGLSIGITYMILLRWRRWKRNSQHS